MFLGHFGLREQPFGATPDPRFLYLSPTHQEVLASLFYRLQAGMGFLSVTAQPGMGKTSLLFYLLEQLRPSARTGFVFMTQCDSTEFFRSLCMEFEVPIADCELAELHWRFKQMLMREAKLSRRVVLMVDEAQNLKEDVLETVRLISDFETPQRKLLQIVFAGQPELMDKLNQPALLQLRQRISMFSRLEPLDRDETARYIAHRVAVAGRTDEGLFTADACADIRAVSKGIPREINTCCFNALSVGYALGKSVIDREVIAEVARDRHDWKDLGQWAEQPAPARRGRARDRKHHSRSNRAQIGSAKVGADPVQKSPEPSANVEQIRPELNSAQPAENAIRWNIAQPATLRAGTAIRSTAEYSAKPNTKSSAALQVPSPSEPTAERARVNEKSILPPAAEARVPLSQPMTVVDGAEPPSIHGHIQRLLRLPLPTTIGVGALLLVMTLGLWLYMRRSESNALASTAPKSEPTSIHNQPELSKAVANTERSPADANNNSPHSVSSSSAGRFSTVNSQPIPADAGAGRSKIQPARVLNEGFQPSTEPIRTPAQLHAEDSKAPATPGRIPGAEISSNLPPALVQHFSVSVPNLVKPQAPNITEAKPQSILKPVYPASAKLSHIQGQVALVATVGPDGKVKRTRKVSGDPLLANAAEVAVKQWRYTPALMDGKPQMSEVNVVINFKLD